MKSDSAKNILQQYSGNDLGEIESSSLEQWMLDEEGFDKKSEAMQSVWDDIPKGVRVEGLRSSKSVLSDAKMQEYGSSGKGRRLRLVAILSTAAAVASIIFSAALLYQRSQNEETICLVSSRDGKGDFTLPDGTLVWLNHGSRLTYKGDLQGKERRVTLEGEGYFDVYKDSAHPFVVSAGKMDVKVLGTKFTIFSGDERGTGVYLREGAVEALIPEIGSVSLSPDQALILDSETGV